MTLQEAMDAVQAAKVVFDSCCAEVQQRQGNYNVAKQELEATQATRNEAKAAYKKALAALQARTKEETIPE